jgi:8-oxo-dGTP diphosphatase
VLEETGLDITVGQLTGIYYDPTYDMHHFVFLSHINGSQDPIPSSPEILECGYFAVNDLPRPINDFTCRRIQEAYAENRLDLFHLIGPRTWLE